MNDFDWRPCLDQTLPNDSDAFPIEGECTVRMRIPAARIKQAGSLVRVTLSRTPGKGWILGKAFLGHASQAAGADAWDFDGQQVPLSFGGREGLAVAPDAPEEACVSDPVALAVQAGRDLILSVVVNGALGAAGYFPWAGLTTNLCQYFWAGGQDRCGETAPDGFQAIPASTGLCFLEAIEVADPPLPGSLPEALAPGDACSGNWPGREFLPAGSTLRLRLPSAALERRGGVCRLRFARGGVPWSLAACRAGLAAMTGEEWDFAAPPVAVAFGGQPGATIPAGEGGFLSDPFPLDLDPEAGDLLVALYFDQAQTVPRCPRGRAIQAWISQPGGGDETAVLAPEGMRAAGSFPLCLEALEASGLPADPGRIDLYHLHGGNQGQMRDSIYLNVPAGQVRILLPRHAVANHGRNTATQVRLSPYWHPPHFSQFGGVLGGDWALASLHVGFASREGLFDFEAAPVAVSFPGKPFPLMVSGELWSDWITLPRPWTPADRLLLSLRLPQGLAAGHVSGGWQALWRHWAAGQDGENGATLAPSGGDTAQALGEASTGNGAYLVNGTQPCIRRVELR